MSNNSHKIPHLALGFYCYVIGITGEQMILWRQVRDNQGNSVIRLILFETQTLQPLTDIPDTERTPIVYRGGEIANAELSATWQRGTYDFTFPNPLRQVSELLVLADTRPGPGLLRMGNPIMALYTVKPAENKVIVSTLDWWNQGDFDFGYEWITRVTRDPLTGNIVGDGFRILPFMMDPTATKFMGWMSSAA